MRPRFKLSEGIKLGTAAIAPVGTTDSLLLAWTAKYGGRPLGAMQVSKEQQTRELIAEYPVLAERIVYRPKLHAKLEDAFRLHRFVQEDYKHITVLTVIDAAMKQKNFKQSTLVSILEECRL